MMLHLEGHPIQSMIPLNAEKRVTEGLSHLFEALPGTSSSSSSMSSAFGALLSRAAMWKKENYTLTPQVWLVLEERN